MKKLLSFLLAVGLLCGVGAVMSHAAVDITEEFTNLNFRAAVYETIGKTAPETIFDTDVQSIWHLNVEDRNIQSLAGIDYFTSLRHLYCSFNRLTQLPMLPPGLETLRCWVNQLTTLPELPPGLETLWCSDNQLSKLPGLPTALVSLVCDSNQLSSLPVLPPSLKELQCNENQLKSLPELPLSLEELLCSDNQLTSLPKLPSTLTRLFCPGNLLTSLDVTGLPLDGLACHFNKLTTLDVTGLPLIALNCSHNKMADKSAVIGFTGSWDGVDFVFDPQNNTTTPPAPHFWDNWPPFLVSILRYILFGWLWMRWF